MALSKNNEVGGGVMNVGAVVLFSWCLVVSCRGLGPAAAAFALSGV